MKKNLATLVLLLVLLLTVVGCGKGDNSTETNSEGTTEASQTEKIKEASKATVSLEDYQKEVLKRLNSEEDFISEEYEEFFKDTGFKVRNSEDGYISSYDEMYHETEEYYYPVLFTEGETLYLWYTSEYGNVYKEEFVNDFGLSEFRYSEAVASSAHCKWDEEKEEVIEDVANWCLIYNESSGEIKRWRFGELIETHQVPAESIYVGYAEWEGYLFRSGTDVYALREEEEGVVVIAHDVKYVLVSNYYHTHDCFSQPIFLMTDGSVKVYVGWDGDQSKPDSKDHLQDPIHEGGYH